MLEQKLKNVKARLMQELGQKEIEEKNCYNRICELMTEEGILTGRYKEIDNWLKDEKVREEGTFAAIVMGNLQGNRELKKSFGVCNDYISSKKTKFSQEAQEDINNFERLERETEKYLKRAVGKKEILKEDYEKLVENFLLKETNLPTLIQDEDRKRTTMIIIYAGLQYQLNLKIKKPSKLILGHKEEDLDDILSRI